MTRAALAACVALFAAAGLDAAVELVSPVGGAEVALLPPKQKQVMRCSTQEERSAEAKALGASSQWRRSADIEAVWRATAGERGPWRLVIASDDGSEPDREYLIEARRVKCEDCADGAKVYRWVLERPNLRLGARYRWRVWSNIEPGGTRTGSDEAAFATEPDAPRWVAVEGRTGNFRDIGGWMTDSGRRVRQGLVYRGEAFNDNSVDGVVKGRNRLMVEDVAYLTGTLGIKTDLELRSSGETAGMPESPLGPLVKFVHHSSCYYAAIFTPHGMEVMAENFRLFCDRANYPIYFHCILGADRTGSLAYMLNGLLGVSREDLERDWESTFYPYVPSWERDASGSLGWRTSVHFDEGLAKYGSEDVPLKERIAAYLRACGVTDGELAAFREIMLEQELGKEDK